MDLVVSRPQGLYCVPGDFYIDPSQPVERALLTHAHADHARAGHARYLAAAAGEQVLRQRLGTVALELMPYGQSLVINGVEVSFHPAGHVLGSAQIRLQYRGEVWVISGDYKLAPDATCAPFEAVRCHTFVTESTFGLPIFRWDSNATMFDNVNAWWQSNAHAGEASVLFAYALGKSQRILSGIDPSIGPIICHGAVERLVEAYRVSGVALPPTLRVSEITASTSVRSALVLAPPSAQGTPWLRRFEPYRDALASGWMQLRGARRRRALDHGFVLSDHADWPSLLRAVAATEAQHVITMHGYAAPLARWLEQNGVQARTFDLHYERDEDGPLPVAQDAEAASTHEGSSA